MLGSLSVLSGSFPSSGPANGRTDRQRLVRLATQLEFGDRSGVYVTGDSVVQSTDEPLVREIRTRLWRRSVGIVGIELVWR
jgi:hypothetical protein